MGLKYANISGSALYFVEITIFPSKFDFTYWNQIILLSVHGFVIHLSDVTAAAAVRLHAFSDVGNCDFKRY